MGAIVSLEQLEAIVAAERARGRRIVLTNGCFDLLHVGHVRLLRRCRELGDVVIVGVNDDGSVRQLKGPQRPIVPAAERAEVLAALAAVDYVAIFPETTAERLAAIVRPDVYAKGADYRAGDESGAIDERRLPEASVVRAAGGRIELVPLAPHCSTTALVERIRTASFSMEPPHPPHAHLGSVRLRRHRGGEGGSEAQHQ
jgi:rfaE bifunctional protein nucleotidyltransferase chain/domain